VNTEQELNIVIASIEKMIEVIKQLDGRIEKLEKELRAHKAAYDPGNDGRGF
jgi:cell division septum initiation protein DivIVA